MSSRDYRKVKYARTALLNSDMLTGILSRWYWPPRRHEEGIRTKAARHVMEDCATENVKMRIYREMREIIPLTYSSPEDVTEDALL